MEYKRAVDLWNQANILFNQKHGLVDEDDAAIDNVMDEHADDLHDTFMDLIVGLSAETAKSLALQYAERGLIMKLALDGVAADDTFRALANEIIYIAGFEYGI